jgi:hypothetical protein
MPDRSKVMTRTKRDTLVLQVGGWGMGLTTPSHKIIIILENRPTVLKTEEDSRSQRLKEWKSQGEVDVNSQG